MGDPILDAGNLRLEIDPPVAVLTLDRPEALNAQTPATWVALNHARTICCRPRCGSSSSPEPDVRSPPGWIAPPGRTGPCAASPTFPTRWRWTRSSGTSGAFVRLAEPDRITIAAVRGPAVGAGFQLALACHLIVAADDAVFSLYEVALGLVPDLGGIGRLAQSVGERRTLELAATGRRWARPRRPIGDC